MANCNNLFKEFNRSIRLTDERRVVLREKRNDLRRRINRGYDVVKNLDRLEHRIEFQSQGSYVMDTIINPSDKEDQYDIDDGVYFFGELDRSQRPVPATFHNWVIRSIEEGESDNDISEIKDKNTCVRVIYKGHNGDLNYHVDLPIYYALNIHEPDLADKKEGWHISNPVDFIIWFENKIQSGFRKEFIVENKLYSEEYHSWLNDIRKKDHQLRRIVRYLKAWGDFVEGDMPPGIVMTILAGENFSENERDDIALKDTLINIKNYLINNGFKCLRPTTPVGEDLFADYSQSRKDAFKKELESLIESAVEAIQDPNQKNACLKWQNHLGGRFPCDLAKDEKDYSSLATIASTSNMWCY